MSNNQTSLVLIQSELKAPKNQFNSFGKYNYRSCEDILEALKPLLLKYNCTLTITDYVKEVNGIPYIESICLLHDNTTNIQYQSNASAGIDIHRKGMDIAQCFGASSSYARKYALNGLFLIDDTKDVDATNEHDMTKTAWNKSNEDKPWLNKGEPLIKAKEYLKNGGLLSDIEKKYKLSKEIRLILENELNNTSNNPTNNDYESDMFNESFN